MGDEVRIVESEEVKFRNPAAIVGFPDVGLVGTIAAFHIIDKLKLKEIAHLESEEFPPVVVVHEGRARYPLRIYGNKDIMVVISEIPLTPDLINGVSRSLVEWFRQRDTSMVISLGGIAHPRRLDIDKLKVYGVSSDDEVDDILKENDVNLFLEGLTVGPHGVILRDCMRNNLHSMYLMGESHINYPDPESAASVIEKINGILNLKIPVKKLIEEGEEIKIRSRDLMKRTEDTLKEMQKAQEHEIPMMYR